MNRQNQSLQAPVLLPISVVIPTLDRIQRLEATLRSLLDQNSWPMEIIIVDASAKFFPVSSLSDHPASQKVIIEVHAAKNRGAACQRNEAILKTSQNFVLFMDDDIDLEPGCLDRLWQSITADESIGAAGAVLTNQSYHPPGRMMRGILSVLGCPREGSLAGCFCGPALNFLPADTGSPAAAEWLNLCMTLVRRDALPSPALLPFFVGYSLLEDAALAAHIAKSWKLISVPGARAFHDMRPADYKDRSRARAEMEIVNRWFVMNRVLGRKSVVWSFRLALYQFIMIAWSLRKSRGWSTLAPTLAGSFQGVWRILFKNRQWQGYPVVPSP